MATPDELQQQIVHLEMLVTHLQRDIEALNGVILDQQKQLDRFSSLIGRLDERVSRLDTPAEKFDPQLERPPHY